MNGEDVDVEFRRRANSMISKAVVTQPERVKRSKYGAVPTVVDNVRFASKREAARYQDLKLLVRAGKINTLTLQPVFKLTIADQVIGKYIADFKYFDCESEQWVIEDAKGMKTAVYRLKKKMVKALFNIDIREV